jgi:rhodanese-related sulfurtransferase
MKPAKVLLLALPIAFLAGIVGGMLVPLLMTPGTESLIADFYRTENAVHVSPHSLRKKIMEAKQDFILVDLRSQEEYEQEHVVGAVNIPAYKDKDHSDYGATERIIRAFRALPKGKSIIVYCYSIPCMTGRKVGEMLAENGIYVQHLGIGWNEWRHFWTLWNHEHEWDATNVADYIASGAEPGSFKGKVTITPCTEGGFGC